MLRPRAFLLLGIAVLTLSALSIPTSETAFRDSPTEANYQEVINVSLDVVLNGTEGFYIIDEHPPQDFVYTYTDPRLTVDGNNHLKVIVLSDPVNTSYIYSGYFDSWGGKSYYGEYGDSIINVTTIYGNALTTVNPPPEWSIDNNLSSPAGIIYVNLSGATRFVTESEFGYDWNGTDWVELIPSQDMWISKDSDDIVFHYKDKTLTFEVGAINNGNYFSMQEVKQSVPELEFSFPVTNMTWGKKYALNISNIPVSFNTTLEDITLTYKEHSGFDLSALKEEGIKSFVLGRMKLGFEDLIEDYDVTLNVSARTIYINVSQKIIDGMLYLDPSLTVDGGSQEMCGNYSYDYVDIKNSGVVNVCPYNGTDYTGWLNLTATINISIDGTSSINGDADGYRGGAGCSKLGVGGSPGNSGEGPGAGGAGSGTGKDYAGGGGGYGGNGGAGAIPGSGGGAGGTAYDTIIISNIHRGSGGGSGGCDVYTDVGSTSRDGGDGGAGIHLNAPEVYVLGTITANGGDPTGGVTGTWGGSGGGSGGGIEVRATSILTISGTLSVDGGDGSTGGGRPDPMGGGGAGGGRIKIYFPKNYDNSSITLSYSGGTGASGSGGNGQNGNIGVFFQTENPDNDTTAPIVTIVSPINDSYLLVPIDINITVNEDADWCGYSLNGTANVTLSNSSLTNWYGTTSPPLGLHHLEVWCNDTSGNMGYNDVWFTYTSLLGQYSYYVINNINYSGSSFVTLPCALNGTSGFDFGSPSYTQVVWGRCSGNSSNTRIYYNDNTEYLYYNSTSGTQLDMDVEFGNETSVNSEAMWDTVVELKGRWSMNDSIGYSLDSTSNNNDMIGMGSDPAQTIGRFGYGYNYDGNDYNFAYDSNSLDISGNFTVTVWVKFGSCSGQNTLVAKWHALTDEAWKLSYSCTSNSPTFSVTHDGSTRVQVEPVIDLEDSNWHLVVGRYNGSNISVFTDGYHRGSVAHTLGIRINDKELRFGAMQYAGGPEYLIGDLDEAMIFNRSLSDDEILFLYEQGSDFEIADTTDPTITVSSPSSANPIESTVSPVLINFTATDDSDIDNSTASLTVTLSGTSHQDTSCTPTDQGNSTLFECSINMNYWDSSGSWSINASVCDVSSNCGENTTESFTYNNLKAFTVNTSSVNFGNFFLTDPDITDSIEANNTGNVNMTEINVTGYELVGETDPSYTLPDSAFSIKYEGGSYATIVNATDVTIPSASLTVYPSHLLDIVFRLQPSTLSPTTISQTYSSETGQEWVISG